MVLFRREQWVRMPELSIWFNLFIRFFLRFVFSFFSFVEPEFSLDSDSAVLGDRDALANSSISTSAASSAFRVSSSHPGPSRSRSPPGRRQTVSRRKPRSRNWLFTDFTCADLSDRFSDDSAGIRYLCYGKEVCPKSGREHHQAWVQFSEQVSRSSVQRRLCLPGVHCEIMRGSCDENERYVAKDGEVTRFGEFLTMGQRVDIEEVRVRIKEGASALCVAESNFPLWCRFRQSFSTYRMLCQKRDTSEWRGRLDVILLEGRTRCGKTRLASKYGTYIIGGYQLGWWDGYSGEDCIIIDDFADDIPIQQMLRILDGYQLRLPIKGSFVYAKWKRVIITTNVVTLYSQAPNEHIDAFRARITRVISAFASHEVMPNVIDEFESVQVSDNS